MKDLETAKQQIEKAIDQNGPYTHNLIGLILSGVSSDLGTNVANELVDEFQLTELYGIHRVLEPVAPVKTLLVKEKTREELQNERVAREAAERKAKHQVLVGKIVNLSNEIEALVPGYLKFTESKRDYENPQIYLEAKSEKYDGVYARVEFKRGWSGYHETGKTFVRIETNDWGVNFRRNWTFETKNLAQKVLEKVQEFIKQIEDSKDYRKQIEDKNEQSTVYLKKTFGVDPKDVYRSGERARARLLIDEENYRSVDFDFNLTDFTYKVNGLPTLNEEQFKKVLDIVRGIYD